MSGREYKLKGKKSRIPDWRDDQITPRQEAFLKFLGVQIPQSKGDAAILIDQASKNPNYPELRKKWVSQRQTLYPELYGHPEPSLLLKLLLLPVRILLKLLLLPVRLLVTILRPKPYEQDLRENRSSSSLLAGILKLALLVIAAFFLITIWQAISGSSSSSSVKPISSIKAKPSSDINETGTSVQTSEIIAKTPLGIPEIVNERPIEPQTTLAVHLSAQEFYDRMDLKSKGFDLTAVSTSEWNLQSKVQTRNYNINLRGSPHLKKISATVIGSVQAETGSLSRTFFEALCKTVTETKDLERIADWLEKNIDRASSIEIGGQSFKIYANSPNVRTLVVEWKL